MWEWIKPTFNCLKLALTLSAFLFTQQKIWLVCQKLKMKYVERDDTSLTLWNHSICRWFYYSVTKASWKLIIFHVCNSHVQWPRGSCTKSDRSWRCWGSLWVWWGLIRSRMSTCEEQFMLDKVKESRLKWLGHVQRRGMMSNQLPGRRFRGRPKRS